MRLRSSDDARYIAHLEQELASRVSRQVRRRAAERGWSIRKLAEVSRLSSGAVSALYAGDCCPRVSVLVALAKALGVTRLEDLLTDEPIVGESLADVLAAARTTTDSEYDRRVHAAQTRRGGRES